MEKTIQIINSILDDIGQDFLGIPVSIINTVVLILFFTLKLLTGLLMYGGLIFSIVIVIAPSTLGEYFIYVVYGFISFILRLMAKIIIRDF